MSDDEKKINGTQPTKKKSRFNDDDKPTERPITRPTERKKSTATIGYPSSSYSRYAIPPYTSPHHKRQSRMISQPSRLSTSTIGQISLNFSNESLRTKKIKSLRPVVLSRLLSRQIGGLRDPNDSEHVNLVDATTRYLANYVRSMSMIPQREQRKSTSTLPSWKQALLERYAEQHDIPLTDIYSDYDIVFRNCGSKYQPTYRKHRLEWLEKIEKEGERYMESASRSIDDPEVNFGDICCCPMFVAHIFAPAKYFWRKYFKIWTRKRRRRFVRSVFDSQNSLLDHTNSNKDDDAKYKSSKCFIYLCMNTIFLPFGDFSLSPK